MQYLYAAIAIYVVIALVYAIITGSLMRGILWIFDLMADIDWSELGSSSYGGDSYDSGDSDGGDGGDGD